MLVLWNPLIYACSGKNLYILTLYRPTQQICHVSNFYIFFAVKNFFLELSTDLIQLIFYPFNWKPGKTSISGIF